MATVGALDMPGSRADTAAVARTKHTDPPAIRAARRVEDPRASRGDGDLALDRRRTELFKELGVEPFEPPVSTQDGGHLPRIRRTKARPGFVHPLGVKEIRAALTRLGPVAWYGLDSIELRQQPDHDREVLRLGMFLAPDTILLFEQRRPPWILDRRVGTRTRGILERADAVIEDSATITRVSFPGESLSSFMLFDGLVHELAHHMLQRYTGKRTVRRMRTSEHEARADAFARTVRGTWTDE